MNASEAMMGNQNAVKLKTPELKQMAYEQYCAHLAKGKSSRSWVFKHPGLQLTGQRMEVYIKNEAEFPSIKKELAEAEGFAIWEEIVENTAKGLDKEASIPALQMTMRNKFGWDKEDKSKAQEQSKEIIEASDNLKALARTISDMKK